MKVLVIGKGGREHAIVEAVSLSPQVHKIYCAPGNPGMENLAQIVDIEETDASGLINFCQENKVDLTIVGPDASLAIGIVDEFEKVGLKIFGPSLKAAQMETSKEFAKEIMKKYNVPTAKYASFKDYDSALKYLQVSDYPIVVKFNALAAGKGVLICDSFKDAEKGIDDIFNKKVFGVGSIIIEEFLEGPEFSLMAFVGDGHIYPMELAQDHKRAYDNDLGPNTGGMGAYSPVELISDKDIQETIDKVMIPVVQGLLKEGINYKGVLYGGLMKTKEGIKVIEFNARFGDPETEVVLPRLKSNFIDIIMGIIDNNHTFKVNWDNQKTVGVVLASIGYPEKYQKGILIEGLENLDAKVYHMGTKKVDNNFYTNGGRVLFIVSKGNTIDEAAIKVYNEIKKIKCPDLFYRHDIAYQMRTK